MDFWKMVGGWLGMQTIKKKKRQIRRKMKVIVQATTKVKVKAKAKAIPTLKVKMKMKGTPTLTKENHLTPWKKRQKGRIVQKKKRKWRELRNRCDSIKKINDPMNPY